MSEYDNYDKIKIIRALVICQSSGQYLIDLTLDSMIDPLSLSSFVSAIVTFGNRNMGKIEEISVKGMNIEMVIVSKYDLFLIAIIDRDFFKDIVRKQGEKILDQFYENYKNDLNNCSDLRLFRDFRTVILSEIQICEESIEKYEENHEFLKIGQKHF